MIEFNSYNLSNWSEYKEYKAVNYLNLNLNSYYYSQMDHQQSTSEDSIQVFVRVKPGSDDGVVLYSENEIKLEKHSFAFDRVFSPAAAQEDIFSAVGKKLISHTFQGYNSCVFVYGQTGSGKTFTMLGEGNGLMQRSFTDIFARISRLSNTECVVTCSYYELYNEQIIDLLDTRKERKNLNVRQDVRRGMFVQNLIQESALNADKLIECLTLGMRNRHVSETMMNRESSRSHSVYTVSFAIKSECDGKQVLKTPKLHFVDLAGSERQKMTMATGDRLKEAGNINKSLTTLGMVINALASDKARTHIPYRDSKLTCLLKDSLGGNSKTFIIATVATSILCFQETLSTLNFANRAKMVKVKALINEQSLSNNLEQFKDEIRKLKQEIARLKSQKRVNFQPANSIECSVVSKTNGDLQHKFQLIANKIEDLKSNVMQNNMDSIIDLLQRHRPEKKNDENDQPGNNMDIEINEQEQQGNELLQYMISNHELLKRIHTTMNEYKSLKQEIKSVEFSRRLPFEEMMTPSKFQRNQYQDLLGKRETYIKQLQQKIVSLKEVAFKKDAQNKELKRKLSSMENHKQSEQEKVLRLRKDLEQIEQKHSDLELTHLLLMQQTKNNSKNNQQLQTRLKESKQLYVYAQEKCENERFVKNKLEQTLKQLTKKYQIIQMQKKEESEKFESRIEEYEDKILEAERKEEQLKTEIDILNETLEFNSKKMRQYSQKLSEQNKCFQQLSLSKVQMSQRLSELTQDLQRKRIQYSGIVSELNIQNRELKNTICFTQQQQIKLQDQNQKIIEEYQLFKLNSRETLNSLEEQKSTLYRIYQKTKCDFEQFKVQEKRVINQYEAKLHDLERNLSIISEQLEEQRKSKEMVQQKMKQLCEVHAIEQQKLVSESQFLVQELAQRKNQLQIQIKRTSQLETQVASTKNIVEQHQQLKRTYKQIIIQNYKLKGEYISTSTSNLNETEKNEELIAKVAFYEEKFRLMSIQYNRIQQNAKKLKQKQLNLIKKIQFYEQNQKIKKIHSSNSSLEMAGEALQSLKLQNAQLKQQLSKLTKIYQSRLQNDKKEDNSKRISLDHFRYQLEQKQQKIRKKLENAIKNWDHAKENNCAGMSLEELFECWQKIESESRKKFEVITRSIQREQKLKSQNKFVAKENLFLKERVDALEKDINLSVLGLPRKMVKVNETELQS